jgi:hypothetical protein
MVAFFNKTLNNILCDTGYDGVVLSQDVGMRQWPAESLALCFNLKLRLLLRRPGGSFWGRTASGR